MDLIERIEFIPGPGGAVYGQNAMFGVINVITRGGAGMGGGELAAAYQSPQSTREGRVSWGKVLDNDLDVLVSASGMRSRGDNFFLDFGASGISGVAAGLDADYDRQFNAAKFPNSGGMLINWLLQRLSLCNPAKLPNSAGTVVS